MSKFSVRFLQAAMGTSVSLFTLAGAFSAHAANAYAPAERGRGANLGLSNGAGANAAAGASDAVISQMPSTQRAPHASVDIDSPSNIRQVVIDGSPTSKQTKRQIKIGLRHTVSIRLPQDAAEIIFADPTAIESIIRTRRHIFLIGKKIGSTDAFFLDASGNQIAHLGIVVGFEVESLERILSRNIANSRLRAEAIGDNIVLKGTVRNAMDAKLALEVSERWARSIASASQGGSYSPQAGSGSVINMIEIEAKQQVNLSVKIAEINRSLTKQLGLDVSLLVSSRLGFLGLRSVPGFPVNGTPSIGLDGFKPLAGTGSGKDGMFGGIDSGDRAMNAGFTNRRNTTITSALKALEINNLSRTLAEPNLTALSGEAAKFLVGGEFPVVTSRDVTTGTNTVSYKPYGVALNFVPVVLAEDRINLDISTEVSEPESLGTSQTQSIKVRRAHTSVEVPSGGSMILAGLLSEGDRRSITGIPGAKNVPVLGQMLQGNDFAYEERELIIVVTPYIVKPLAPSQVITPIDGMGRASDSSAYVLGRLNSAQSEPIPAKTNDNSGFMME